MDKMSYFKYVSFLIKHEATNSSVVISRKKRKKEKKWEFLEEEKLTMALI